MSSASVQAIFSLVRGDRIPFPAGDLTPRDVIDACIAHEVAGLVVDRLAGRDDWPVEIAEALTRQVSADAAIELLRRRELGRVIEAVGASGAESILIKGAALAYTLYDAPYCRPRVDTDLLIRRGDVDAVRNALARLGYRASVLCEGEAVFCQFEMSRFDEFGVEHVCDFHWKISTQPVFAEVLSYDELRQGAIRVAALGPRALAAASVESLLLACVHPAMHHRNAQRTVWIHDIHLLVSKLSEADLLRFATLAREKKVAHVCADALRRARAMFHTTLPEPVLVALRPSAGGG